MGWATFWAIFSQTHQVTLILTPSVVLNFFRHIIFFPAKKSLKLLARQPLSVGETEKGISRLISPDFVRVNETLWLYPIQPHSIYRDTLLFTFFKFENQYWNFLNLIHFYCAPLCKIQVPSSADCIVALKVYLRELWNCVVLCRSTSRDKIRDNPICCRLSLATRSDR
jgi:hypothetical protein